MTEDNNVQITEEFDDAFDILENTFSNLFITGKAGTGKTTFLNYFRTHTQKNVVVVAPTGIAAINIKGQTIHSFFRFKPGFIDINSIGKARADLRKIYNSIDILIIDEISMVRADLFDAIATFLNINGKYPGDAFGGCQICIIGDLFQLPPIVSNQDRQLFYDAYNTPYFYGAHSYVKDSFSFIEFSKIFRQSEEEFITLLNQVRDNSLDQDSLNFINHRCMLPADNENNDAITLTSTNKVADDLNQFKLQQIKNPESHYVAKATGDFKTMTQLPAISKLTLKLGAQVMFIKNDKDKRWVNGTVGIVTKLDKKSVFVNAGGIEYDVPQETWELIKFEYNEKSDKIIEVEKGTYKQLPLQLAWAITIHKSQGKTFNNVTIDFGNGAFAPGQAYVALSRARNLNGLKLKRPLRQSDIINNRDATLFLREYE
jgi:ATP-dependent DNA helicase PIF1